jgi:hypothetical protein
MRRQGKNRRQVLLPDKGMGAGTTTFIAVQKNLLCGTRADNDFDAPRHARLLATRLQSSATRSRYFGDRTSRAVAASTAT